METKIDSERSKDSLSVFGYFTGEVQSEKNESILILHNLRYSRGCVAALESWLMSYYLVF